MAKTAVQKRDGAPPPHVEVLEEAKGPQYPPGRMLVASPLEVQDVISRVPPGRVLRLGDLRATLAIKFRADYTCAMTTGIFLRIVAEAAHEERGKAGPMLPYWRVVRDDGELIDKLPGGVEAHAAKLEGDGVDVFRFGARRVVGHIEHYAWVPPPPKRRGKPPGPSAAPSARPSTEWRAGSPAPTRPAAPARPAQPARPATSSRPTLPTRPAAPAPSSGPRGQAAATDAVKRSARSAAPRAPAPAPASAPRPRRR